MFSLAIIQGIQFIIAFFTLSETIFDRPARGAGVAQPTQPSPTPSYWKSLVTFRRRSTASWALVPLETIRPLSLFASPVIFLPVLGYSVLFSYSNGTSQLSRVSLRARLTTLPPAVLLTVEIPSLLGRKFGLNAQQTGLQFVGASTFTPRFPLRALVLSFSSLPLPSLQSSVPSSASSSQVAEVTPGCCTGSSPSLHPLPVWC